MVLICPHCFEEKEEVFIATSNLKIEVGKVAFCPECCEFSIIDAEGDHLIQRLPTEYEAHQLATQARYVDMRSKFIESKKQ